MSRKTLLTILLVLAIIILIWQLPIKAWLLTLQTNIKSFGLLAPVVYALVYVVATLLLIPGSVLTLGAAPLFGFWQGFAIVVISANLAAFCAFLLARTTLRARVAHWAAENPKFAALDRAIGQNGFKMVLLSRLSPAFPFTMLNYLLGISPVNAGAYALANFFGMLPGTFLYVYLGSTASDAITAGANQPASIGQTVLKVVGLLATIGVVIFVTRIARKALNEAESQSTPLAASSE